VLQTEAQGALPMQLRDSRESVMIDETRPTPAPLEAEIVTLRQRVAALEAAGHGAQAARRYAEQVVDTMHEALLVLDDTFRIVAANRAF
jgi:PAS domain-containing protein